MSRDYQKEKLIIKMNTLREEGIKGAVTLVNTQKIGILVINDSYANTTKEINVAKLNREEVLKKMTEAYHEMFAIEVDYIQEKNLIDGPYLSLSWKQKPSILGIKGPGFK